MNALRPLRFSLVAGLTSLIGLSPVVHAQSVATTPVGAVTKDIPVGLVDLGVTLVNAPVLSAGVMNNTASAIVMAGVGNVGSLLSSSDPYYVEITAGVHESERFEVDVPATKAADNSSIVIKGNDALNTLPSLANVDLAGSSLVIRKHFTLRQVSESTSPAFVGNNNPSLADQIWLFDSSTKQFVVNFLRGDGVTWRRSGTTTVTSDLPIPSGTGVLIRKTTAATKIVMIGSVRMNDYIYQFPGGLSFHSIPDPMNHSPSSFGGTATNGWMGNNNPSLADQIWTFNANTGTFVVHFLRGDGVTWRVSGTTTEVTQNELLTSSSAFMVKRLLSDDEYIANTRL